MPSVDALMKQRVTQTDVARAAGVHNTTVSLCLRNCASIPESTRKRIRAIADEMGYYPDPTLQALVAYRKGRISNRKKETIAYITNWETRWGWRSVTAREKAYIGAQRKAAELGYQLEHFWLGEPGMTERRMSSMLYHRGITGVLLAAHEDVPAEVPGFEWAQFSAVKIGCVPHVPALHRVIDDHNSMIRLAMRQILAAGFQRVGFVLTPWWDESADEAWSAGYLAQQSRMPASKRIPVLRLTGSSQDWMGGRVTQQCSSEMSALAKWYHHHRPEAIVGFSPVVLQQIEQLGLLVPRDVAYVDLCLERSDHGVAGVRQNAENIGEVAAAILVTQIQQNFRGLPTVATSTMVDGTWVGGASLPQASAGGQCDDKVKVDAEFVENALLIPA